MPKKKIIERFTNSIGMEFVLIPPFGVKLPYSFMMGSPDNEPGHRPNENHHEERLKRRFYVQTTTVTQKQWTLLMGEPNPSKFKLGEDYPVEMVSWEDANEFIKRLNTLERTESYRLPTEIEWECACRANTETPFAFGKCLPPSRANYDSSVATMPYHDLGKIKYCFEEAVYLDQTVSVKSYYRNAWRIYNMHGNVGEWCQDWYRESLPIPKSEKNQTETFKSVRGGNWTSDIFYCRSAARARRFPYQKLSNIGFRLVKEIVGNEDTLRKIDITHTIESKNTDIPDDYKNIIGTYYVYYYNTKLQGDIDEAILKIDYCKNKKPPCEDFEKFYRMEFAPLTATCEIGANKNKEGEADFYYHDVFIGFTATHMYIIFGGIKKHDEILSIVFPCPLDKNLPNSWWALWSGISRGDISRAVVPMAARFFIMKKRLPTEEVKTIFDGLGITIENSVIIYEKALENKNIINMNENENEEYISNDDVIILSQYKESKDILE